MDRMTCKSSAAQPHSLARPLLLSPDLSVSLVVWRGLSRLRHGRSDSHLLPERTMTKGFAMKD